MVKRLAGQLNEGKETLLQRMFAVLGQREATKVNDDVGRFHGNGRKKAQVICRPIVQRLRRGIGAPVRIGARIKGNMFPEPEQAAAPDAQRTLLKIGLVQVHFAAHMPNGVTVVRGPRNRPSQ